MIRVAMLAAFAIALTAQSASAQSERHRNAPRPGQGQGQAAPAAPGGVCVASGFARLSRNCRVNTGGCVRMPEQCPLGWCCP